MMRMIQSTFGSLAKWKGGCISVYFDFAFFLM